MNVVLFNPLSLCQYKLYIDMFFLNKTGISYHLWSGKLFSNLQANQKNPLVSGMGQLLKNLLDFAEEDELYQLQMTS